MTPCPPPCPWSLQGMCAATSPTQHETWTRPDVRRERGNHFCPSCRREFDAECDKENS